MMWTTQYDTVCLLTVFNEVCHTNEQWARGVQIPCWCECENVFTLVESCRIVSKCVRNKNT